MLEVILFLLSVFVVSFSGAIAPGPVTATTITLGTRNRYAGTLISIGHGIIEIPLILMVLFGLANFLNTFSARIFIGLAGGTVLIWMAAKMLNDLRSRLSYDSGKALTKAPVFAGIILSASNPYFYIWWLTVGVKFAADAMEYGWIVFAAFIFAHWLADLVWFQFLSFAAFKGAAVMSERNLKLVLSVCAFALMIFGLYFLYDTALTAFIS